MTEDLKYVEVVCSKCVAGLRSAYHDDRTYAAAMEGLKGAARRHSKDCDGTPIYTKIERVDP